MDNMQEYLVEYLDMFTRWNDFNGRSNLRKFWMAVLINIIAIILLSIIGVIIGTSFLGSLYTLFVLIPSLALTIRRLIDGGRTWLYILWIFLPFIGWIVLLIQLIKPSI
ncbi:MAG: DUF805 domain-containing protein [Candidatus Izemoplasma sp.]